MDEVFFPYESVRGSQDQLIKDILDCVKGGKNLIAHAPTGLGKCVTGDTKVLTKDGLIQIKNIKDTLINTLNEDLKITKSHAYLIKKPSALIYLLKTNIGRTIKVTKDHKFLSITKRGLDWIPLQNLKKGDYIALPRKVNLFSGKCFLSLEDILSSPKEILKDISFSFLSDSLVRKFSNFLKQKKIGLRTFEKLTGISRVYWKSILMGKEINFNSFQILQQYISFDLSEEIYSLSSKNRQKSFIIKFDDELAYFVGCIVGDGHICNNFAKTIKLNNMDIQLLERIRKFLLTKGSKLSKCSGDNCDYSISYKSLAYFLRVLGIPFGKKSHLVSIPKCFFRNKSLLKNFLRGLYDTDGSASGTFVEFSTKSKDLQEDLVTALLCFEINPIVKPKIVRGKIYRKIYFCDLENLNRFYKSIGFYLDRKNLILKSMLCKKSNPNLDIIPNISQILHQVGRECSFKYSRDSPYRKYESYIYGLRNPSRNGLKRVLKNIKGHSKNFSLLDKLSKSDIFWDRITTIKELEQEELYDLSVPQVKNFIGNNIILHNTAATFAPILSHILKNNSTLIFITPRHTQHTIAVETIKQIKLKFKLDFSIVDLIGKKEMCALGGMHDLSSYDFAEYCRALVEKGNCDFYNNTLTKNNPTIISKKLLAELEGVLLHNEELKKTCVQNKVCPYELACLLGKKSKVIIADYFHILNPRIRETIFKKMDKSEENTVLVIDEAHNLVERSRELLSAKLSSFILSKAIQEAKSFHLKEVVGGIEQVQEALLRLSKNKLSVKVNEALITKQEFLDLLDIDFVFFLDGLKEVADRARELTKTTYCASLAEFLEAWQGSDVSYIRVVRSVFGEKSAYTSLEYKCMDSSTLLKPLIGNIKSTIMMSGTLSPTEVYKDLFGIEATCKDYISPFPKENKLTLIVPETTTKFTVRNEDMFNKISKKCAEVVNNVPGNSIIFFPSYFLLDRVYQILKGDCEKTIFLENSHMNKVERKQMLERFRQYQKTGAVLLGVSAGSFGEGIDLIGEALKAVVVVGLPLGKPDLETQQLINYYDVKFGKGWYYGYTLPAMVKTFQNAGRCIRSESDRGIVVFLDERYVWDNYFSCFPDRDHIQVSREPAKKIKEFFAST